METKPDTTRAGTMVGAGTGPGGDTPHHHEAFTVACSVRPIVVLNTAEDRALRNRHVVAVDRFVNDALCIPERPLWWVSLPTQLAAELCRRGFHLADETVRLVRPQERRAKDLRCLQHALLGQTICILLQFHDRHSR